MANATSLNSINAAAQFVIDAAKIATASSLYQAQVAAELTRLEAEGIEAQLAIQQVTTVANIAVDLEGLVSKNALMFAGKGLELYTMMAQQREKMLGLFSQIAIQRAATSWSNMKQMTQNFKF